MFSQRNRLFLAAAATLALAACGGQGQSQNAMIPQAAQQGQAAQGVAAAGAVAQGAVAQAVVPSLSTAEGAAFDLIARGGRW